MTGTIQTGIDLLPATGAEVFCLDGTYYIATGLVLDSYQTLKGCGRNTIFTATVANLDIITATGGSGTEKVGILIADLCVDGDAGSATNDCGIIWSYVDESEIRNCVILDNAEEGISLTNCDWNTLSDNVIKGHTSTDYDAIWIDASCHNVIAGNKCTLNDLGITLNNSDHNTITGNTCNSNASDGIALYTSDDNTVTGNTCNSNTEYGIEAGGNRITVSGNTCNGNTKSGILLDTVYDSAISGNTCDNNTEHGIFFSTTYNTIISQNTCDNNTKSGMEVCFEKCNLLGNHCSHNGRHGLYFTAATDSNISGNVCIGNSQGTTNTYDDILLDNTTYCLISNNVCRAGDETNKPRYGINVFDSGCTNNKVISNDLYDDGFVTGAYNDDGTGTIYVEPGIDDTPVNGETGQPISSNWAYDHENSTTAHGGFIWDAGVVSEELTYDARIAFDLGTSTSR